MASQITHVVYGQVVIEKLLSQICGDRRKFFIGTLLPDIRFLNTIPREKVHIDNPTVDGLRRLVNPFEQGFYAHSLIDYERELVLEKLGFYKSFPVDKNLQRASKLFEDQLTFKRWENWGTVQSWLDEVLQEETEIIDVLTVKKWHGILKDYFSSTPTNDSALQLARKFGFPEEIISEIKKFIILIQRSDKGVSMISRIQENLFASTI